MAKSGRRQYARDNRGRFASVGATARGGRLKTAGGNKRQTVAARVKTNKIGTIKASRLSPEANFRIIKQQKGRFGKVGQAALEMRKRGALKSAGDIEGLAAIARRSRHGSAKGRTPFSSQASQPKRQAPKRLEFAIQYHGTSRQAANAIRRTGFRESRSGVYGAGVYSSSLKSTALKYTPKGQETLIRLRVPKARIRKAEKVDGGDMVPMSVRARNRAAGVTTVKGPMTTNPKERWLITTGENATKWIDKRPIVRSAGKRRRNTRPRRR